MTLTFFKNYLKLISSISLIVLTVLFFTSCSKNITPNNINPPTTPVLSTTPIPSVTPNLPSNLVKGADISWVSEMEASGLKFYTSSGQETDCFTLMKSLGVNSIRLRVWVNPVGIWNGTNDVVAKAIRAKNAGLKLLIDFHYSDTWADPGKQAKPALWANQDFATLKNSLSNHTINVLSKLKDAGVTPEWVQIGNETNNGFLWPDGMASTNMSNFSQLINAGYDCVKSVFPLSKVIVHISNGWDNNLFRWIFDGLKNNGAKWDIIGMSLYPTYTASGWQNANTQCLQNMNDMVSRYGKEVMIVEVGMPWDSQADTKLFLQDIITKVKSVSDNKGIGVFYWEPQAYNNWKGYTLGAFDNTGKPTIAMDAFAN